MAQPPPDLTRDDLLARLRESGAPVSASQLHRWVDAGVLPKPRRRGLGRGEGTQSFYPYLALLQARALYDALRVRRNLDDAAWMLWMIGFPLTGYVRELLLEEWTAALKAQRRSAKAVANPKTAARVAQALGRDPGSLAPMLRAVRPESVPTVAAIIAATETGELKAGQYGREAFELVQDGVLSLIDATDAPAADLPTPEQLEANLVHAAATTSLPKLIDALKALTDNELCVVRNEVQELFALYARDFGQPEPIVSRPDFRQYFAKRVLDVTARPSFRAFFKQLGWQRPPMSPLRRLLTELEQQPHKE